MKTQVIEDGLIAVGVTVSIADIQNLLSVILLIFNIVWILVKFGIRAYNHIKNKEYSEIENDVKETKDELETLSQKGVSGSMKDK